MYRKLAVLSSLAALASAQQVGTEVEETHPPLTWSDCTGGECAEVEASVALDHNWRWVHGIDGYENCYDGNEWIEEFCPDNVACAENCALEGGDYEATYGITTEGGSLTLKYQVEGESGLNVGSRVYLMEDESTYKMFQLKNKEFTFDVDVSGLPCGTNGALYFVTMDADGGMSRFEGNKAGAKYGTGYCDAQCARDLKFINGEANVEGWEPSETDPNGGVGNHGACCPEMDVWEANSISTAFTPHSCDDPNQIRCTAPECGGTYGEDRYAGPCDPDGCDFNAFRFDDEEFYGEGMVIDTSKPFTVVTQFLTDDGTDAGMHNEIKRFYVQGDTVIPNAESKVEGITGNSINQEFCDAQKEIFGDPTTYKNHGGWESMSAGMEPGMVLVMSLWDDQYASMDWLDAPYPPEKDVDAPGVARGTCEPGVPPSETREQFPDAQVIFSNIKFGPLDSTFPGAPGGNSTVAALRSRGTKRT